MKQAAQLCKLVVMEGLADIINGPLQDFTRLIKEIDILRKFDVLRYTDGVQNQGSLVIYYTKERRIIQYYQGFYDILLIKNRHYIDFITKSHKVSFTYETQ